MLKLEFSKKEDFIPLHELENRYLKAALEATGFNLTQAVKLLHKSRNWGFRKRRDNPEFFEQGERRIDLDEFHLWCCSLNDGRTISAVISADSKVSAEEGFYSLLEKLEVEVHVGRAETTAEGKIVYPSALMLAAQRAIPVKIEPFEKEFSKEEIAENAETISSKFAGLSVHIRDKSSDSSFIIYMTGEEEDKGVIQVRVLPYLSDFHYYLLHN